MSRWSFFFYLALIISPAGLSQPNSIDFLGNLWIITIDKSGSMLWNSAKEYTWSNRTVIADNVAARLSATQLENINFKTDRFIFYYSGILNTTEIAALKFENRFDTSFIHHTDSLLHSIKDKNELIARVKYYISTAKYNYRYSFVSQIRLFSIIKTINYLKTQGLTDKFNRFFLMVITDDADQNDQWMNDYKIVKKYAPDRLREVNELTTKYLYNPFNARSDISKSGTFIEGVALESQTPHINLFEYRTTQSAEIGHDSLRLLSFRSIKDTALYITLSQKEVRGDPVTFAYIDSVYADDNKIPVKRWLTDSLILPLKLKNKLDYNHIRVKGYAQVSYSDSILGKHYKKINFLQSAYIASAFFTKLKTNLVIGGVLLLFLILLYVFIIVPNSKIFVLYDTLQNKMAVKRGKGAEPFNSWSRGENIFLSYTYGASNTLSSIFKKQKNLTARHHEYSVEDGSGRHSIVIVSRSPLSIDNPNHVDFELFSTEMRDVEEFHDAREINPLFQSIYHKSSKSRLIRWGKKYKIRNTWLFNAIANLADRIGQKHYYIFSLKPSDFESATISLSPQNVRDKSFTIELGSAAKQKSTDSNEQRNIQCLNAFYASSAEYADGMITVNVFEDRIVWNVLKMEDQKSLRQVYHIFHFTQKLNSDNENKNINKDRNIVILKQLAAKKPAGIRKCAVFITGKVERSSPLAESELDEAEIDTGSENLNNFVFKRSCFQSFLYLVETAADKKRSTRQLYSPFRQGMNNEVMTQTPARGTYLLYSAFAPVFVEKEFDEEYTTKLADNIFSFSAMRDMKLNIENRCGCIVYANHSIKLNEL